MKRLGIFSLTAKLLPWLRAKLLSRTELLGKATWKFLCSWHRRTYKHVRLKLSGMETQLTRSFTEPIGKQVSMKDLQFLVPCCFSEVVGRDHLPGRVAHLQTSPRPSTVGLFPNKFIFQTDILPFLVEVSAALWALAWKPISRVGQRSFNF